MKTFTSSLYNKNTFNFNKITKFNLFSFINYDIPKFYEIYVDMRSDVKTLPTEKMRKSVLNVNFGDESSHEDPTMNKLCKELASLFGKERVLFVPTGTMGNMLSVGMFTPRDNYLLQGSRSHIHLTETGSQLTLGFKPFPLNEIDEIKDNFNLEQVINSFEKDVKIEQFAQKVKVMAFENTHNYNGGKIMNTHVVQEIIIPQIKKSPLFKHLKFHLDGSRVLNAAAALKVDPQTLVAPFDTVNICLSKGLGAPAGSVILMDDADYQKAKEVRKNLGGSMRQAGFLAAPALVALEDWRDRFEKDHSNAKLFAQGLSKIQGLKVSLPETNIVNIYLDEKSIKNENMIKFVELLARDHKILINNFDSNRYIRAVVHHQVSKSQIMYAIESIEKVARYFVSHNRD